MYVYIEIYVLLSFNFDTLLSANVKECLLFDCFNMLCIDCHGNKYIDYVGRCCYSLDTGIFVCLSERVDYVTKLKESNTYISMYTYMLNRTTNLGKFKHYKS
jgi:hypothetical protein